MDAMHNQVFFSKNFMLIRALIAFISEKAKKNLQIIVKQILFFFALS